MKETPIYEDLSLVMKRTQIGFICVIAIFLILILSFWKVQILDHSEFWKKSEANRIKETVIPPQRGLILDRDGKILAKNIASFQVSIIRENCEDLEESCQRISELLGLEKEVIEERIDKFKSLPQFRPIVIKDNLTEEEVAKLEARKLDFPELVIRVDPKRNYPHGILASHVLGYLQELSENDLKSEQYRERHPGDLVGKNGIERIYEGLLVGTEGRILDVVDSQGRIMEMLTKYDPIPGKDVKLTLDLELQMAAEKILEGREGAVVVMDPQSGEILAMASYPNFDPNKFINRFTPEEWLTLVDNPEFPLENRTIRGLYSPGSIFKLTMAIAGLDARFVTDRTAHYCGGSVMLYGRPHACWQELGHGSVNLYSAIEKSCNIYFYHLGREMGIDTISRYANMLGFGSSTGIDLYGEKSGLVPDKRWKKKVKNESWYPGETISISIGQSFLLVTPLQVAVHTALIANRGKIAIPFLVSPEGKQNQEGGIESNGMSSIDLSVFEKVIQGMWMSVNREGTAVGSRVPDFDICGKTGSTQVVSTARAEELEQQNIEIKTHSWFTGFAPRDDPKVVVTVLVEYGGGGGETAAPLARQIFEAYRNKND
jgi:penicillin-binding protein 2